MTTLFGGKQRMLGKVPKIKKRESMVFDHRGGREGHPKPNPYSDLRKHFKPKI